VLVDVVVGVVCLKAECPNDGYKFESLLAYPSLHVEPKETSPCLCSKMVRVPMHVFYGQNLPAQPAASTSPSTTLSFITPSGFVSRVEYNRQDGEEYALVVEHDVDVA
jgi:hypothetical protein